MSRREQPSFSVKPTHDFLKPYEQEEVTNSQTTPKPSTNNVSNVEKGSTYGLAVRTSRKSCSDAY